MSRHTLLSQATWISGHPCGGAKITAPAPYLRTIFTLPSGQAIRTAELTITALGLYEAEINGRRVGNLHFSPGWTDYTKRVQYQVFDVSRHLFPGENVLGAILGDGWYAGHLGHNDRQKYGDRPLLLARLDVTLSQGATRTILTDASWKTSIGPILESDIMMGESYDARRELGKWSSPSYDDQSWTPVFTYPATEIALVPPPGPPVREIEEISPISIKRNPGFIFDFGQNFSGKARLTVEAPRGTTVRLDFGEMLNPDGTVYRENLRNARCSDFYTCKGGGRETWSPRFTFHGFRYVEVQGAEQATSLSLNGIVLHSDMKQTGHFSCSSQALNQLQHNILWGQKSNFLDIPTDCPQRDERVGWTGDAQVFIRTAAFNMDVRLFFHKWLRDIRDAQTPAGAIPVVVPYAPGGPVPNDAGPAWSDATIICPWTIYLCYGDKQILEDHYESMRRYMDFLAGNLCKDHIRSHPEVDSWGGFGDWLALDGSASNEGNTPRDIIGTAYYAHDADLMSKIAKVLKRSDDEKRYGKLHGKIVSAFRGRFVTPEGLVASGTQTSYVLALKYGLLPDAVKARAVSELVRDIERRGFHLATGFVGTPHILDALEENGRLDVAYKLLEQETFPSWLFPVKHGATTIWERWDGWTPEKGFQDKNMNSFNHYAYGAVGAWMVRTVAGLDLDPENPGYRHILFRPRPGGNIASAQASLETAYGKTGIRWNITQDVMHIELLVPQGTHATLTLAPEYAVGQKRFGPGQHTIKLNRPAEWNR